TSRWRAPFCERRPSPSKKPGFGETRSPTRTRYRRLSPDRSRLFGDFRAETLTDAARVGEVVETPRDVERFAQQLECRRGALRIAARDGGVDLGEQPRERPHGGAPQLVFRRLGNGLLFHLLSMSKDLERLAHAFERGAAVRGAGRERRFGRREQPLEHHEGGAAFFAMMRCRT